MKRLQKMVKRTEHGVFRDLSFPLKDAPSGLAQFFATKSPLKTMKNAFCFTSKALSCSQDI